MGAGYHGGFGNTRGASTQYTIQKDKQGKHLVGHRNYKVGRSIFSSTLEDAENLVKQYAGTGIAIGAERERIDFGKIIGQYVDQETGQKYPTTIGIIHYAKDGCHIVPARPKDFKQE